MASWFTLKQIRWKRGVRIASILLLSALTVTQYQNCTPVGDSPGVGGLASVNTVNCNAVPAPSLSAPPAAAMSGQVGLGVGSGTVLPAQFTIPFVKGAGRDADDNCTLGAPLNNGLNVNCQVNNNASTLRVTITTDDDAECLSGTATVTLRVRDDVCRAEAVSAPRTFQLTVTNSCPAQQRISKDGSVAPELTPARLDQFGGRVAIANGYAVVSALGDDQAANNAGAAFVYKMVGSSWVYQQKLIPASAGASTEVESVAISNNLIVLGAPAHGNFGAIWTYRLSGSTWVASQGPIVPSASYQNAAVATQNFGASVAVSGSTVLVGMPGYYHANPGSFAYAGGVLVYTDSGSALSENRLLAASDKAANDAYGFDVATNGTIAVVGAGGKTGTNGGGKAYAYSVGSWTETILSSNLPASSKFGSSVAIGSSRIVVGAPGAVTGGNGPGAIVAFDLAGVRKETIFGSDDGMQFGGSVSASGNDVLVGAAYQTVNDAIRSGMAHLYRLDGAGSYKPYFMFRPRRSEQGFEDHFGDSVALGNGYVLGGAPADDLSDTDMGSAFFIKVP